MNYDERTTYPVVFGDYTLHELISHVWCVGFYIWTTIVGPTPVLGGQ